MPSKSCNFSTGRVLAIGDIMLDEYWFGDTTRISPEAPVPVVLVEYSDYRAGGAANVALNIAGLGCSVDLIGIVGDDQSGKILQQLLDKQPKIKSLINITKDQPTINKLRIISNNQQLFRVDKEKHYCANSFKLVTTAFQQYIANPKNNYNVLILSDYNKGTLQDPQFFISQANQYNIPIIIDPKNPDFLLYKNATILTPNLKEFQQMVNVSFNNPDNHNLILLETGHNLIKELNLHALIITQGKNGLTLLTHDYQDQHFASHSHEVFDVTGAGDTVTATIAACVANGQSLHTAAHLATIAAGIVVGKIGTSCILIKELANELKREEQNNANTHELFLGIIEAEQLAPIIEQQKLLGETIVFVNGCFDVLHAGHVHYLEKAKSFGDRLIVAVNDDASIKILKGNNRPINNLEQRMQLLKGLKAVDWVVPFGFNEIRPGKLIETLNPSILIKSKDSFKTIEEFPEYEGVQHVLKNGGKVYLLERPLHPDCNSSSTKIIEAATTGEIYE